MENQIQSGTILISKPFMEDKRFEKSIILIVEHNKNGTIGFVINKETSVNIHELISNFPEVNIKIKDGGPVEKNSVFFIHTYPDLINNCAKIKDGVFWGGELKDVVKGIQNQEITSDEIAFFIGYVGWEEGQLEYEIKEGSWIIHQLNLSKFNQKIDWSSLLIEVNKEYKIWATAPSDFHLN